MDKVYLSTPTKIAILDHEKKRTFVIRKDGLPDAGEINLLGYGFRQQLHHFTAGSMLVHGMS